MRVLWLLLVAGSMAREDMERNVFLFPNQNGSDYVLLTPMVTEPLDKLTVCLRIYTNDRRYALFNVGTTKSSIEMSVVFQPMSCYSGYPYCSTDIFMNTTQVSIPAKANPLDWNHICVTWDSDAGVLQLWVNGKLSPRTIMQEAFSVDLQKGFVLGQKRHYYDQKWDSYVSFQGEISDVHMWNRVLPPATIGKVLLNKRYINGNVISWRSLKYTVYGNVIVQPKLQCRYCGKLGLHHPGLSQQNINIEDLESEK
ncbi:C-reactive protein [Xenopus tropicalis]|nr:C-reactive protein [Xenopus tropicalis]|eukprot:XP_012825092.1 PREDICTED: C-reactive protein-like [Xenopus tropicalis]